jgi:hypothetical protein
MKKSILTIGKVLNSAEQKEITGGFGNVPELCVAVLGDRCYSDADCCYTNGYCEMLTPHPSRERYSVCM